MSCWGAQSLSTGYSRLLKGLNKGTNSQSPLTLHSLRKNSIKFVIIKLLVLNRLNYKENSLQVDISFPGEVIVKSVFDWISLRGKRILNCERQN